MKLWFRNKNRHSKILILSYITVFMLLFGIVCPLVSFGKPIENQTMDITYIYDIYDLQNMSNDLSGDYELANNISADITIISHS